MFDTSYSDTVLSSTLINSVVFLCVFFVSLLGVYLYRKIALRIGIIANLNYRALHEVPVPRGGGIIFSLVFVANVFALWWMDRLSEDLFFVLGVGGSVATIIGFLDDLKDISAYKKFIGQICLSVWVLFWFEGGPMIQIDWLPRLVASPLSLLFLVWMINAYNFMDGIDGMAVSGAIFVAGSITLVMFISNVDSELPLLFFLLMACVSAFIVFNWPPASIFMGDAGSIFLGYVFGSFILFSVMNGEISVWTWLVVFGYFFADTTVTQILRIILVKKWYCAHRSHAYQNLARITGSHLKITGGVTIYHLVWLLPLTLWTALQPEMAALAAVLALVPGMALAYKYGPNLSSS